MTVLGSSLPGALRKPGASICSPIEIRVASALDIGHKTRSMLPVPDASLGRVAGVTQNAADVAVLVIVVNRRLLASDHLQHDAAGLALLDALDEAQVINTQAIALTPLEVRPTEPLNRSVRPRELGAALDRARSFVDPQALLPVQDGALGVRPYT